MTEQHLPHGQTLAPLRNVAKLLSLIERVESRPIHLPGMACFYGPSGWGKTTATTFAANEFDAYVVEMASTWTIKMFLEQLAEEMGLKAKRTIPYILEQVAEHLAITGRTLIIDEADFLVKRNMIEVARDIYRKSRSGVILVGEELLPQNLQKYERVHGRIIDWVQAVAADRDDLQLLARIDCPGLDLDEAILDMVMEASQGSARRIRVNLNQVWEFAKTHGLKAVDAKAWGSRHFFTGEAPLPRHEGRAALRAAARRVA